MTELSPAAQAVLDAFWEGLGCGDDWDNANLAAALCAAADQINHDWSAFNCIDALYEIAAELEGQ
jgi:hypothetical protein